jgi:hypothetical protein
MKMRSVYIILILSFLLLGCQAPPPITAAQSTQPIASPTPTAITPTKTPTSTHTPTATATPIPLLVEATVWRSDPLIPILNYHRFVLDSTPESTGMKLRLSDFRSHLVRLYEAGYSLISLDDLLSGNLIVPEGRKPLVLSMDDAYFADQLFLDENGEPSLLTGIGVLFAFYQEYPDFGFDVPLFVNFGDKYYGNYFTGVWWIVMDGWEDDLGQAIVWGIENGVIPYNHTYTHVKLDITADAHIDWELSQHDLALRDYLERADRLDLVERINNYIALPYGIWPASKSGIEILTSYTDPEGRQVRGIFEAGYEYSPEYALAPFSEGFDPFRLPRMAGIGASINDIVSQADTLPSAETCPLFFEDANQPPAVEGVKQAILQAVVTGQCPEGVYIVDKVLFRVENGQISEITPSY